MSASMSEYPPLPMNRSSLCSWPKSSSNEHKRLSSASSPLPLSISENDDNMMHSPLKESQVPEEPTAKRSKTSVKAQSNGDEQLPAELIADLPNQRRDIVNRQGACFTLMVAGESGLGKTTFINTLFNDKFKPTDKQKRLFERTPVNDYYEKTTKIDIKEAEYEERRFKVLFTVIDTPGFGDFTNNRNSWVPIVNYIDEQHLMYMLREEQPDRQSIVDTRVNACLYFIRPSGHGLLPLDIKVMQELSTRVNLIPILAKADSFTLEDREYFKSQIRKAIDANHIQVYQPNSFYSTNSNEHYEMEAMPFAIICSEDWVQNDEGHTVRGRQYQWGVAEVDNEEHCDFAKLRRLLMSTFMLDLIDNTVDQHYEHYRQKTILQRLSQAANNVENGDGNDHNNSGIDTLKTIWKYGKDYLHQGMIDSDPIYHDKVVKTQEKFDVIVQFQEDKFEQWRNELKNRQNEYNNELEQIHNEVLRLQAEVRSLEASKYHIVTGSNGGGPPGVHGHNHRNDPEALSEGKPQGRSGRYNLRGSK